MRHSEPACKATPGEHPVRSSPRTSPLSFVAAYLLMVSGVGRATQAALNLAGSGLAATYLWRKRALPNVLLNVAWAVITLVGLLAWPESE
jgi:hypothetical protein